MLAQERREVEERQLELPWGLPFGGIGCRGARLPWETRASTSFPRVVSQRSHVPRIVPLFSIFFQKSGQFS